MAFNSSWSLVIASSSLMLAVVVCSLTTLAPTVLYTQPATTTKMQVRTLLPEPGARVQLKSSLPYSHLDVIATESKTTTVQQSTFSPFVIGIMGASTLVTAAIAFLWNRSPATQSSAALMARFGEEWTSAAIALEEDYPGPGNPDDVFEVRVIWDGEEKTVSVKGDQSILMACEEAGMVLPSSCRHGVCLSCTAKVVEGIESARKDSQCHNTENVRAGYVCTCSTYVGGPGLKLEMGKAEEAYKAQFGKFEAEEKQREEKKKNLFGF